VKSRSKDEISKEMQKLEISGLAACWYNKNFRNRRIDELGSYAQEVSKHDEKGSSALEIAPGRGYL